MKSINIFIFLLLAATSFAQSKGYVLSNVPIDERVQMPMGEVSFFNSTGTEITIALESDGATTNLVLVNPTTVFLNDGAFDNGGGNTGRLRYTGTVTKWFHVACTVSVSPATTNDAFILAIAKNGTIINSSRVIQKSGSTSDTQSTALHVMVQLAQNEYLELYAGNITAARNMVIKSLNLFAMGM